MPTYLRCSPHLASFRTIFPVRFALHLSSNGFVRQVVRRLDAGAAVNYVKADTGGMTALHVAAHEAHHSVVATLIARGACVDLVDFWGHDAAWHAVDGTGGHADRRRSVVRAVPEEVVEEPGGALGMLGGEDARVVVLRQLLASGAVLGRRDGVSEETLLHRAATHGRLDLVRL